MFSPITYMYISRKAKSCTLYHTINTLVDGGQWSTIQLSKFNQYDSCDKLPVYLPIFLLNFNIFYL